MKKHVFFLDKTDATVEYYPVHIIVKSMNDIPKPAFPPVPVCLPLILVAIPDDVPSNPFRNEAVFKKFKSSSK